MIKLHGKKQKQTTKTRRFPDETLDTQTGIDEIDRYIRAAASKILKTRISKDTTMEKIKETLIETNIAPETLQTQKARQGKVHFEMMEDKIQTKNNPRKRQY